MHHRVARVEPGPVELVEDGLRHAGLLRQAVVVLLDPGVQEAGAREPRERAVRRRRRRVERIRNFPADAGARIAASSFSTSQT